MMPTMGDYDEVNDLIEKAKIACGITDKMNFELSDDEIRVVINWIGQHNFDTETVDGITHINRRGVELMLTSTLECFPGFFQRYGLSQFN